MLWNNNVDDIGVKTLWRQTSVADMKVLSYSWINLYKQFCNWVCKIIFYSEIVLAVCIADISIWLLDVNKIDSMNVAM